MSLNCLINNASVCSSTDAGTGLLVQLINTLLLSQISLKQEYNPDRSNSYLPEYDFIVVGSGSGGSAVSAALASNSNWNVLLIEAGSDPQLNSVIPLLFFTIQETYQDWHFYTEPQKNSCLGYKNRQCAWPRGKMVGGCSAHNAMIYAIGNPHDYNEWERLGNEGWSWQCVRKYFKDQIENTLQPGPMDQTDDNSRDIILEIREALLSGGCELGYKYRNNVWEKSLGLTGFFDVFGTIRNGERVSAARAYIAPLLKQKNFHIIKNGLVTQVLIDPRTKQVEGIQLYVNNKFIKIRSRKEVILSAGTINTPKILMLSGIGPKEHLLDLGIDPIENLPVGEHLFDHTMAIVPLALHKRFPDENSTTITNDDIYKYFTNREGILGTTAVSNIAAYINPLNPKSNIGEVVYFFMYFSRNDPALLTIPLNFGEELRNQLIEANKKSSVLFVLLSLLRPKSEGCIKLKSKNPFSAPLIDPNIHSHPDDLKVLLEGYRELENLVQTEAMQAEDAEIIKLKFKECDEYEYDSDDHIICLIRYLSTTEYHPVGTARMGISNDSVVDPRLRVRGIKGLRVADGSIMPKIIGGNTNAPITMIGQKAGDLIKEDWLMNCPEL